TVHKLHASPHELALDSFPTRRSSDLARCACECSLFDSLQTAISCEPLASMMARTMQTTANSHMEDHGTPHQRQDRCSVCASDMRSEEHTSELQSRFDLVCRLLLEKKK